MWNALRKHRSRTQHTSLAHLDPHPDECLRRHPAAGADDDRLGLQIEGIRTEIMRSRAKIGALGDAYIGLDRHLREAQDGGFFTDPDMVSHCKPPWEGDIYIGADHHTHPYFCPEEPQEPDTQRRRPWPGCLEENTLDHNPRNLLEPRRAAVEMRNRVLTQVHIWRNWRLISDRKWWLSMVAAK